MNEGILPGTARVKKRAPTACIRCRKQKIKCSGRTPCEQCARRSVQCVFGDREPKAVISQSYLAELQRLAYEQSERHVIVQQIEQQPPAQLLPPAEDLHQLSVNIQQPDSVEDSSASSEDEDTTYQTLRTSTDPEIANPLDPNAGEPFIVNSASKRFFLGVSSNWSFGRRVLNLVHESVNVESPTTNLLFEGSAYNLGWDGKRDMCRIDTSLVPTADYAMFMINTVKFHCGRLYHLFDEQALMEYFAAFYEDPTGIAEQHTLWYVHFILILSFGKALSTRVGTGSRFASIALFKQAMQLLPDITYLHENAVQSMEMLCCVALYLQCLDMRSVAYNIIGQAMRMATEQGLYTGMQSRYLSEDLVQRCREIWWTTFILDRQMTSLLGVPVGLSDEDITAPLPAFGGSSKKSIALHIQVQLAKATAVILQTVYRITPGQGDKFVRSMKNALGILTEASEERNKHYPLDLKKSSSSICRLAAYLHLYHHQALVLATRPLLYSFLQKRLKSTSSLRVSSLRRTRNLVRVCISSAQQCLSILDALQIQGLLESFLPFDREATFSSALALVIAHAIDHKLVPDKDARMATVTRVLDEMSSSGNVLADYHKRELEQIQATLDISINTPEQSTGMTEAHHMHRPSFGQSELSITHSDGLTNLDTLLGEWNSEDEISGEHLLALADTLDPDLVHWFSAQPFG